MNLFLFYFISPAKILPYSPRKRRKKKRKRKKENNGQKKLQPPLQPATATANFSVFIGCPQSEKPNLCCVFPILSGFSSLEFPCSQRLKQIAFLYRSMVEGNRVVTVSALQFACTDDVSTNLETAERFIIQIHALFLY